MNRKQRRATGKLAPRDPPADVAARFGEAIRHHRDGRPDEADRLYRQILARDPRHAESLHQRGMIALQAGRLDLAAERIAKAVALSPDDPWYLTNLGAVLHKLGRLDDAIACHCRAIELKPAYADAHNNLGAVLLHQWRFDEAQACFDRALEINPGYAEAHTNLGNALREKRRLDEAVACQRRAIELAPGYAEAHNSLGSALQDLGRLDEAVACYHRALALKPGCVEAHTNLGTAMNELGRLDEAFACYRRAIALGPDYPEVHWQYAYALLSDGQFRQGWEEYHWRWRRTTGPQPVLPDYSQPMWAGEPADGRTMLLWSEQGFGDRLHFVRYVPDVVRLGWRVILVTSRPMKRLFAAIAGITLIEEGEAPPAFDVHCPLLSLPRAFGTTLDTIPAPIPYLHPAPELVARWRDRLSALPGLKVGVVWRGNPQHNRDRQRSMNSGLFARFLDLPGLAVVSLQLDGRAEELAALGGGEAVLNAGPELGDYADTAALVANLDLVIAVDTSVCHLAGALGIPTWTLVDFAAEWRWLRNRDDSPWYPTMRLFRQPTPGDWPAVVERVRAELASNSRLCAAPSRIIISARNNLPQEDCAP